MVMVACSPQVSLPPATNTVVPAAAIVAVTEGGQLPTRPAPRTITPTPTADLLARLATQVPFLTPTPFATITLTPVLRGPATSTPRPTQTRPRGPSIQPAQLWTPTRPPTRTPAPRGTFTGPGVERPEEFPEAGPTDSNEPNDSQAEAVGLGATPLEGAIGAAADVDVFAVNVATPDVVLVVTLSDRQASRYQIEVVGPRGGKVGRQRLDGTTAMRALAEVGTEVGTYFVFVRSAGRELPQGPYFITADVTSPMVTPTPSF